MRHASDPAGQADVMQVCLNGHVITDLLHGYPERGLFHCDACGAQTIDHCATCGARIPGAVYVPGLTPAGARPPPQFCATCGAPFPWTRRPRTAASQSVGALETMLRRLPRVVRELRWRHGTGPAFSIETGRDLEDLLRALLSLHSDIVHVETRTPRYAPGARTDCLLPGERIALCAKLAGPELKAAGIAEQLREDADYYKRMESWRKLIAAIYDPEGLLNEPDALERAWSSEEGQLEIRCIIARP
jgi:hypothetical protein